MTGNDGMEMEEGLKYNYKDISMGIIDDDDNITEYEYDLFLLYLFRILVLFIATHGHVMLLPVFLQLLLNMVILL